MSLKLISRQRTSNFNGINISSIFVVVLCAFLKFMTRNIEKCGRSNCFCVIQEEFCEQSRLDRRRRDILEKRKRENKMKHCIDLHFKLDSTEKASKKSP